MHSSRTDPASGVCPDSKLLTEVVAHDLRSPLNGILAAAQYLLDDAAHLLTEEHVKLLRSIELSSHKLFASIDDLLELSALEPGSASLNLKPTDIRALIESMLAMSPLPQERKEFRIDLGTAQKLPLIAVDAARISRVLDKLFKGSIEWCGSEGNLEVRLRMEDEKLVIWLRAEGATDWPGESRPIPDELSGMSQSAETGRLGFLVAERIVESHGGTIRADHSESGCAYTVTIPISRGSETIGAGAV